MDSTSETKNEAQSAQSSTVRYVREVIVNYRGRAKEAKSIPSAVAAAEWIRNIIPDNSREHAAALYLDAGHKVVGYAVVATGTANMCLFHPREVFQRAVLLGAVAVIAGHNHPSDGVDPSTEDENVTRVLREAGQLLGIKLLDHVIVGSSGHYSFAESGSL